MQISKLTDHHQNGCVLFEIPRARASLDSYTYEIFEAVTAVNAKLVDKKVSNDVTEIEHVEGYVAPQFSSVTPVYSTPEDVHNFNIWYYEQVAKKSTNPKRKNLKETEDVYKYLNKSENMSHCKSCSCTVTKTNAYTEARDLVKLWLFFADHDMASVNNHK